jgi:glycosyltransferase involved in cell wall biosynthesis
VPELEALSPRSNISRPARPTLSLVVPVFNEEDSIAPFLHRIRESLDNKNFAYEIIFINDGSSDRTLANLIAEADRDQRIIIANLTRNFGKEAALVAGIDLANGDAAIPMDVDLQDPPELITDFVEKWRQGYDVVYGVRTDRTSDTKTKRATAGWFYRLFNAISDTKIPENAGDFRLLDRRVLDVLKTLPERTRFMKGLYAWVGFSTVGVPYERPARVAGDSKWNYLRLWSFALDGFVSFSTAPLKVWLILGAAISGISFIYGSVIFFRVLLLGRDVPGYASVMIAILFFGGMQLLSIGVIGEYLSRLFVEVKARPIYLIESVHGALHSSSEDKQTNVEISETIDDRIKIGKTTA